MNQETVRAFCKRQPHATENLQWGDNLCFKIGGKLFCVMPLEPEGIVLSFKASPENFHALQEIDGIIAAPYMARASWVALRHFRTLTDNQLKDLLAESHQLVFATLTRKLREELTAKKAKKKRTQLSKPAAKSKRTRRGS